MGISPQPRHAAETARTAIAAVLGAVMCTSALAFDPAIEDLRSEIRRLFPTPASSLPLAPVVPESPGPYTIVHKEYLLARPDFAGTPASPSLRRIREYPAPLRGAHAACVKVITPFWHGSGVIVSSSGDVLTSYHLVAGVTTASVQTIDGRIHPIGAVKAHSAALDLALVHIDGGPYVALDVRAGTPAPPGSALFVVGHPGNRSWALTDGQVIRHCADAGTEVMHFDSNVARGSSGGPIIDADGQLCAITACIAELADGSKVKVGIAAAAIGEFLKRRPGDEMLLPDLAVAERNRQMTEFLELIYAQTEALIVDWQTAMANVDVEALPAQPAPPTAQGTALRPARPAGAVSFANTRSCAASAVRLLVFQTLLKRLSAAEGLSPELRQSMRDYVAVLDNLIDAAALLSQNAGTPAEARRKLRQAAECRVQAEARFGTAVIALRDVGRGYGRDAIEPGRYADLDRLGLKYAPTGCRVQRSPAGG